jgi:hypothetical protein
MRPRVLAACSLALAALPTLSSCGAIGAATGAGAPAPVVLFDGRDLGAFDTFVRGHALNEDPDRVFRVEDGTIHVSGTEYGYVITKRSYRTYRLTAEFRWGVGTFGNRAGKARDSGILYHVQGPDKIWPRSLELQIQEGATGDFWMTDSAAITGRDGVRVVGPARGARPIPRFGKGPWRDVVDYRDPTNEVERPRGEWNVVEVVVRGDTARHYVNGKLVNEGTALFPGEGKILFQSEGAEIYFRNIRLYPLP